MTELHKKQISSLLDNELELAELKELTDVLNDDSALSAQLDRYALIRAVLSDNDSNVKGSLLKRVHAAISLELPMPLSSLSHSNSLGMSQQISLETSQR